MSSRYSDQHDLQSTKLVEELGAAAAIEPDFYYSCFID